MTTSWRTHGELVAVILACGFIDVAATSAPDQTVQTVKIAAPLAIARLTTCNANLRPLSLLYRQSAMADLVSDHHREVPIQAVDRTGPLDDSPAPRPPAPTDVATGASAGVNITSSVPVVAVNGLSSVVNEPTVASRGDEVLYTGNWYTAFSSDGGTTFDCIEPDSSFPHTGATQPFCCDQVAVYSPAHDVMVWLLQYDRKKADGTSTENIHRLAVASGADIRAQQWHYYDLKPSALGGTANEWFDYPDLAVSNGFLYLTSNAFGTTGSLDFTRSVVARFPLEQMKAYAALDAQYVNPTEASTLKLVRGATDTMYFATHVRSGAAQYVRIYTWQDKATTIQSHDVLVQRWSRSGAVAPGPDGDDWLARLDGRIAGGWITNGQLGFVWPSAQAPPFKYPNLRVLIVSAATKAIVAEPHLWNDSYAFAYAAAAPNSAGVVGVSIGYGGNKTYPSHAVGMLENTNGIWRWRLSRTVTGSNGPGGQDADKWGDYLSVQPDGGAAGVWVASGFTLQGGSSRAAMQPRFVKFRAGSGAPNTFTDQSDLLRALTRLEATWAQQPNNVPAIRTAISRLNDALEVTQRVPEVGTGRESGVDDTHRPTPGDSAPDVVLTGEMIKNLMATAAATIKQLSASLDGPQRNLGAEKAAIGALSKKLTEIK